MIIFENIHTHTHKCIIYTGLVLCSKKKKNYDLYTNFKSFVIFSIITSHIYMFVFPLIILKRLSVWKINFQNNNRKTYIHTRQDEGIINETSHFVLFQMWSEIEECLFANACDVYMCVMRKCIQSPKNIAHSLYVIAFSA